MSEISNGTWKEFESFKYTTARGISTQELIVSLLAYYNVHGLYRISDEQVRHFMWLMDNWKIRLPIYHTYD